MTSLQGFGSADVTTPFHYGSVVDGIHHNPTLEQKLKKKYWKTKQTVIQKLHKSQDEFVIAGDADIDTKLEVAYHLRSSCHQLLQTLEKYCFRLRDISAHELAFGEYLGAYSEKEYTNAGQVMKSTGKVLQMEAKARLTVLPGLQRLYQEMATFEASALSDLSVSIHTLEKARTDYRAALLWMKDVSGKLQNPDYRDQLVRFREAQGAVKESKTRFEKLKVDLTEKIGMVNASRCNLLSRSLPTYQTSMLTFSDSAASEFYRVLVNLRSHHHHQYKLHSDMEEIRDLEVHELFESSLLSAIDGGSSSLPLQSSATNDDDALIDVSGPPGVQEGDKRGPEVGKEEVEGGKDCTGVQNIYEEMATQQAATMNDLPLNGVEADLRELQRELLQEFGSSSPPRMATPLSEATGKEREEKSEALRSANMDLNDLLGLGLGLEGEGAESPDYGLLVSSECEAKGDGSKESDTLTDQWDNFSSFMTSTRSPVQSAFSEWEKEFAAQQPSTLTTAELAKEDPFLELDPLAAAKKRDKTGRPTATTTAGATAGGKPSSGLADDLLSLTLTNPPPLPLLPGQQLSAMVPVQNPGSSVLSPQLPMPLTSAGPRQGVMGGAMPGKPHPSSMSSKRETADKGTDKKGTSWMNVFAHLDPLSNEKA